MTIKELRDFLCAPLPVIQDPVLGLRSSARGPWRVGPSDAERQEPQPGAIARKAAVTEWDDWKPIRDVA